jgi:predicted nuclease of predicted toxin-antitoxin system
VAVPLYMDVHIPQQISDQLRRRGADVLTAIEDGWDEATDQDLLEHARELGRVIFTHDIRFRAMAED